MADPLNSACSETMLSSLAEARSFCFVDGLSVPVQCSDVETLQRAAYNGYHHDKMCNNVFAFSPEGKVIYAATKFEKNLKFMVNLGKKKFK